MDPEAMPWRTIDAASTTAAAPASADGAASPATRSVPIGTLAVGGAAVLIAIAAFALAFGSGGTGEVAIDGGERLGAAASGSGAVPSDGSPGASGGMVVVEIVGAVVKPGVYRLPIGSRVDDLLAAAGGFGPRVDTERAAEALNRAAVLSDGAQVRVPSRDDPTPGSGSGTDGTGATAGSGGPGLVDLNAASGTELEALPGIGPVTANKIIASREEARFTSVDDLRARKLLGEKTFDGLKDLVTVR